MNKIILMGRLTRDPEIRYSSSAEPIAVAKFGIAVNRRFRRPQEPEADFFNCTAFGKQAEFMERYWKKGMQALVSGRLQIDSWDDKQTGQKRTAPSIIAEEVEFTESKAAFESRQQSRPEEFSQENEPPSGFSPIAETVDDDLPF